MTSDEEDGTMATKKRTMAEWEAVRAKRAALTAEARSNGHSLTLKKVERSPYGRAHLRGQCRYCGCGLSVVEFSNGQVEGRGGALERACCG